MVVHRLLLESTRLAVKLSFQSTVRPLDFRNPNQIEPSRRFHVFEAELHPKKTEPDVCTRFEMHLLKKKT